MRKNLILYFLLSLIPHFVWSQYYIDVTTKNTTQHGNSYLIDVPRNIQGNLFIQDAKHLIPLNIYEQLSSNLDTLFVAQNTVVWKNNHFNIKALGKPSVIYLQGRYNFSTESDDTLKDFDERFAQYKKINQATLLVKKDSVLIYYEEDYGSSCCPRDPKYDRISINDFINEFEKRNHVKIGKAFIATRGGDEGEHSLYFTLSGLTAVQKLNFIEQRRISLLSDSDAQEPNEKYLYTPIWVGLIDVGSKQNSTSTFQAAELDMDYSYADTIPQFPGGMEAFLGRFKSIKSDVNENYPTKTLITFVVRRDGTVTDGKVLRTNKEKQIKKVEKLIKENKNSLKSSSDLQEMIRLALRKLFNLILGKKPLVLIRMIDL